MTGQICDSCTYELPFGTRCRAEEYKQMIGRAGGHGGCCWGGRFPTKEDAPLPRVDKEAARRRGAFKARQLHQQLQIGGTAA